MKQKTEIKGTKNFSEDQKLAKIIRKKPAKLFHDQN